MKRVFIAIKINPGSTLLGMISSLKALTSTENIKWIDQSNIHLTLAFLGNTEEKVIKSIDTFLANKCPGFHDFVFSIVGTGVFKNFRDPRVLWAGISESGELSDLYDLIMSGLKQNGFPIEKHSFRPHITIGRIKSIRNTDAFKICVERYRETLFQEVKVNEVILFESILKQTGPVYNPLGRYPL